MKIKRSKPEMGGKRAASTDLNHENWDAEEEPEEAGNFQMASQEELRKRVIKKAGRKLAGRSSGDGGVKTDTNKSIFSGFSGFGSSSSTSGSVSSSNTSPFSFLSKLPSNPSAIQSLPSTSTKKDSDATASSVEPVKNNNDESNKSNVYYKKLKSLNQSVVNWIKTHVDQNPLCILTPVFQDYERYLKEIEKENSPSKQSPGTGAANGKTITSSERQSSSLFSSKADENKTKETPTTADTFSFAIKPTTAATSSPTKDISTPTTSTTSPTFSFGINKPPSTQTSSSTFLFGGSSEGTKTTATTAPGFSFGGQTSSSITGAPSGFSFSGNKPFTFSSSLIKPPEDAQTKTDAKKNKDGEGEGEDVDEDEPPKVEVKLVVEEGSVYSKKCKVFIKQKNEYSDRGVGTLHLIPVKETGKTQLLVRANTNLGNILLNVILNESIPTQKVGKKNVSMGCIPTPDSDPKPTLVLLRVKTEEDTDELFEMINKYKK